MILETLEYIGIAFAGAFMLILLSKFVMPIFLKKKTNYYEAPECIEEDFFNESKTNNKKEEKK